MKRFLLSFFAFGIFGLFSFSQIPTDSLVMYLPFNGNADDESGHNNNGVVHGATLTEDRFGTPNSAYYFDGSSTWIEVANNPSINFHITDSYSISVWVKIKAPLPKASVYEKWVTSFDPYPYVLRCHYGDNNDSYFVGARYIGDLPQDSTRNQGAKVTEDMVSIDTVSFHHIVTIFDPDKIQMYYDGELRKTSINYMVSGDVANSHSLYIGRIGNNNEWFFHGIIDDMRIYHKALDAAEVKALYYEGKCHEIVYDTIPVYDTTHIVIHDTLVVNDTIITEIYDTIPVYDSIAVTDTLIIDAELTGVNPPDNINTLKVYPNPSKDHLYINTGDYTKMTGYHIKIVNSGGVVVFETEVAEPLYEINLSTWTGKGMYYIQVIDSGGQLIDTRKIVLQ